MPALQDSPVESREFSDRAALTRRRVLTTRSVPERESLEFWHDAVLATLVGMDISAEKNVYDATMWTDRLGDLQITVVECDPGMVHRSSRFIAHGDDNQVFVALQSTGSALVEQDGRSTELKFGDIGFFETNRPFRTRYPERFRMKIFAVPRSVLGVRDEDLRKLTARALRPTHGVTALLSPFMDQLADDSARYDTATAGRLARSLAGLLAATAADHLDLKSADLPGADDVLLLRIKAFIRWHLSDPDLSPQVIARAHGISVRYLHKLFGGEGTSVGRWIRDLRLRECRAELATSRAGAVSVGQVARRWGFSGTAHFGRVFRSVYGVSPSDWLQQLDDPVAIGATS